MSFILILILIIIIETLLIVGAGFWIYSLYKSKAEKRIMQDNDKTIQAEQIKHDLDQKKDKIDNEINQIDNRNDFVNIFNKL